MYEALYSFEGNRSRVIGNRCKLSGWTKSTQEESSSVVLSLFDGIRHLPKYQLIVATSLGFSISVYGWFLPDNQPIYLRHKCSVRFTKAFPLLSDVRELKLCTGLTRCTDHNIQDPVGIFKFMRHSIPKVIDPLDFESSPAMRVTVYKRHNSCLILSETDQCSMCHAADAGEFKRLSRASRKMQEPVKDRACLTNTSRERLVIRLKQKRLECKLELKRNVEQMTESIRNKSIPVASELHSDLLSILSGQSLECFPMIKIFWEQQQKAIYGM